MEKRLIQVAGGLTAAFAILHLALYWALDWEHALATLAVQEWATINVLNIHVAFTLLAFAALSLFQADPLLTTPVGRIVTWTMVGFWFLRVANEFIFYRPGNVFLAVTCALVGVLYLAGLLKRRPAPQLTAQPPIS